MSFFPSFKSVRCVLRSGKVEPHWSADLAELESTINVCYHRANTHITVHKAVFCCVSIPALPYLNTIG